MPIGQSVTGPLVGRSALGGWIATAQTMLPAVRFAVEVRPIIQGNLIAIRWRASGPHGAARIDLTGTDILRVEDAPYREYWANTEVTQMMRQMGMLIA